MGLTSTLREQVGHALAGDVDDVLAAHGAVAAAVEADPASEELRALLDRAVKDRLRHDRVGIFFSGGLDSAAVAAVARHHVASGQDDAVDLAPAQRG